MEVTVLHPVTQAPCCIEIGPDDTAAAAIAAALASYETPPGTAAPSADRHCLALQLDNGDTLSGAESLSEAAIEAGATVRIVVQGLLLYPPVVIPAAPQGSVAVTEGGRYVATTNLHSASASPGVLTIWDTAARAPLLRAACTSSLLAWSHCSTWVAYVAPDRYMALACTAGPTHTLEGSAGHVSCIAAGPEQTLVSGSHNGAVCAWDVASGRLAHRMLGHTKSVSAVAATPRGTALSVDSGVSIREWSLGSGSALRSIKLRSAPSASWCSFSPSGTFLMMGTTNDDLRVFDVAVGGRQCAALSTSGSWNAVPRSRAAVSDTVVAVLNRPHPPNCPLHVLFQQLRKPGAVTKPAASDRAPRSGRGGGRKQGRRDQAAASVPRSTTSPPWKKVAFGTGGSVALSPSDGVMCVAGAKGGIEVVSVSALVREAEREAAEAAS